MVSEADSTTSEESMKKQKAELRILTRIRDQYAVAFYASLQGYDLYCGSGLGFGPKDMFRHSYHESGKPHLRIPTPAGRAIGEASTPLEHLTGKQKIGGSSTELQGLKWGYQPKPDSATRRTVTLDVEALNVPGFTSELWALEPGKPELVEEVFQEYKQVAGMVLAYASANWCTPSLLAVAWTLRPEAWAALERSMQAQSG
jgi:hypothetical protein